MAAIWAALALHTGLAQRVSDDPQPNRLWLTCNTFDADHQADAMARIVGIVCSTGSWRIGRYRCRRCRPVNCRNRLPHHLVGSLIQILLVHSGQLCAFGEMAGDIESSESFDGRQQVVAHPRAQRIVVRQLAVYRIAIGGVIPIFHTQVFTEAGGFVSSKGQQRPAQTVTPLACA